MIHRVQQGLKQKPCSKWGFLLRPVVQIDEGNSSANVKASAESTGTFHFLADSKTLTWKFLNAIFNNVKLEWFQSRIRPEEKLRWVET